MADFGTHYNADTLSANYILPTLEANSLFIPGLTVPADMHIMGESAFYYESTDDAATTGNAGRKLALTETGFKKVIVDMKQSIGLGGVIPGVGRMINGADPVQTKAVEFSLKTVKKHNELGVAAMAAGATQLDDQVALTSESIYGKIVDAKEKFVVDNNGIEASYIIVSPAVEGLLLKSPEFIRKEQSNDAVVYTGVIGSVAGLVVLKALTMPRNGEFLMGCESSFLAPYSLSEVEVFGNVEGYPGAAAIQSEYTYGFKVTKQARLLYKIHN